MINLIQQILRRNEIFLEKILYLNQRRARKTEIASGVDEGKTEIETEIASGVDEEKTEIERA